MITDRASLWLLASWGLWTAAQLAWFLADPHQWLRVWAGESDASSNPALLTLRGLLTDGRGPLLTCLVFVPLVLTGVAMSVAAAVKHVRRGLEGVMRRR